MNKYLIIIILLSIIAGTIGFWVSFGTTHHQINNVQPQPMQRICTIVIGLTNNRTECWLLFTVPPNDTLHGQQTACSVDIISKENLTCYVIATPGNPLGNIYHAFLTKSGACCHTYDWDNGCQILYILGSFGILFIILVIVTMVYMFYTRHHEESVPLISPV